LVVHGRLAAAEEEWLAPAPVLFGAGDAKALGPDGQEQLALVPVVQVADASEREGWLFLAPALFLADKAPAVEFDAELGSVPDASDWSILGVFSCFGHSPFWMI
jgi:hypothetical protein